MGKRYGEPYDPMLRLTEHGSKLYNLWKKIMKNPHCEEWGYFPTFYDWAMQGDHEDGAWLCRIDREKPYCPDNCVWYSPKEEKDYFPTEWADEWNKTVNRIRKYCGMPPLEGTDYADL